MGGAGRAGVLAACFLAVPSGDVLAAARALADIASGQLRIIGPGNVASITNSARAVAGQPPSVLGYRVNLAPPAPGISRDRAESHSRSPGW
jgi:hypothetical protein